MKLLCVAPGGVMHDWFEPGPALVVKGKELVELRNCPEHDGLPYAEGPGLNSHRLKESDVLGVWPTSAFGRAIKETF